MQEKEGRKGWAERKVMEGMDGKRKKEENVKKCNEWKGRKGTSREGQVRDGKEWEGMGRKGRKGRKRRKTRKTREDMEAWLHYIINLIYLSLHLPVYN